MPSDNNYTAQRDPTPRLNEATIMMVDDEQINMDIIQIHLEKAGYQRVITTDQSEQAMALLIKHRPDVLLLDLQMPGVTGFDILREVRADEDLKHLPVIILTSSSEPETKLQALELGATDFLSKPADPSELVLRLRNTLMVKAYHDQLAYYDAITGLPNRRLFLDRLDWALKNARREQTAAAILRIQFDQIKQVGDTLGSRTGEELIKAVAYRLQETLRRSDVITRDQEDPVEEGLAHFGSGEFTVLLPRIRHTQDAALVARRIIVAHDEIIHIEDHNILVRPYVGISVFPEDGAKPDELLAYAGSASSHARQQGQSRYQFYSKEINKKTLQRMRLVGHLRKAIDNGDLQLYYQPKIHTASGRVVGMEALIRWISPELGMISPKQFIPVAEETGLITRIGAWTLQEACRQVRAWHDQGLEGLRVSVNVSSEQFRHRDLPRIVTKALEGGGLDPRCLVLELTESMVMGNPDEAITMLQQLKQLGLSISIDDFGTGYSSLSYLKKFRLDELKIDRSFVTDLDTDDDDQAIVTAVIALAHSLGLKVVAEGVETEAQLAVLKRLHCDEIQGFYFSKPLPKDAFPDFVTRRSPGQT